VLLIDDLLMLPISSFKFILGQIEQLVDRELNDEGTIKAQLLELQMRLELEEISEEDYKAEEADLFARLRVIRQRQMETLQQVHTKDNASIVIDVGGDGTNF
jgi:hypothetical protein